jgi:hypothetical protein
MESYGRQRSWKKSSSFEFEGPEPNFTAHEGGKGPYGRKAARINAMAEVIVRSVQKVY